MAGIVSYGAWIPRYRITTDEIARVWGKTAAGIGRSLNVAEKSVAGPDEDTTTLSVEASRVALRRAGMDASRIGAVFVGSESHVYAVKPTATMLAAALGVGPRHTSADLEFACKAGTAAIQACMGLVDSGMFEQGLAVGADTSQGAPGDVLEYSASAGAAAFVIGRDHTIADINHTTSYTSDTPDFWRREGERYPTHAARFTGEPAYFRHTVAAAEDLFRVAGTKPGEYDHAVFHQPNGKFPVRAAKKLGFQDKQVETGLLAPRIGNTYSGAVLLGLAAVLDIARPGDRLFVCGYGSGAGSDAFDVTVTDGIRRLRREGPSVERLIEDRSYLDYATYAKFRGKIQTQGASA